MPSSQRIPINTRLAIIVAAVLLGGVAAKPIIYVLRAYIPAMANFLAGSENERAKAMADKIRDAVDAYVRDHKKPPVDEKTLQVAQSTLPVWGITLDALLGKANELNPQGRKYLDIADYKKGEGGVKSGKEPIVLDPWGIPFQINFDFDGDGKLADPQNKDATLTAPVLVMSNGHDKNPWTWENNVCSWKN